ncbi:MULTISPECIES: LysR substrate-binding domain-containing protein [unclassified Mesorhizobium]|uniref:LysR substrate-binding domain-containing protein n=1 Tax=unclassified Mesorhizobium TaxID=325217 RepID=UPI001CC9B684|nr:MULTISPECIES: LysR substrate-binding domain-containing protein [unclassified Mesorhizobium]MBZ9742219.1 hypothetical protein [Mesorhizobium sp. CO1-1-4]MBZ9805824.1 hypothetical protein [Mesorhizobium sp. ES1-6]MBZ9996229.1 hypothetical protein [Mesorhizobium sp. BH1-1-4]
MGLGFLPFELAAPHIASGRLAEVLAEWCPSYEGYHLYYPSRKQNSPAFSAFVEEMRYSESHGQRAHPPALGGRDHTDGRQTNGPGSRGDSLPFCVLN